jgi:hypothetical protein
MIDAVLAFIGFIILVMYFWLKFLMIVGGFVLAVCLFLFVIQLPFLLAFQLAKMIDDKHDDRYSTTTDDEESSQ